MTSILQRILPDVSGFLSERANDVEKELML